MKYNYSLGLDLGIASVGWCLVELDEKGEQQKRIIDLNSHVFEEITKGQSKELENVARREKRSSRRTRRRRWLRIQDVKKLVKNYLNVVLSKDFDYKKYDNPYSLKVKGLREKLSKEELAIILAHYVKYRGFKSNRKSEEKKDAVGAKLLGHLEELEKRLKDNEQTISEYLLSLFSNQDLAENNFKVHNSDLNYQFTATRAMYLDEINRVLNKQIEYKLIDDSFKNKYLEIFSRQRDFSEGPGEGSPFGKKDGKSLIELRIGKCAFDDEPRAPKTSFSAESFVVLSFLNNIRFKEKEYDNYHSFSQDQIKKIYSESLKTNLDTYKKIFKVVGIDAISVKGLIMTKKNYVKALIDFKKKKNIPDEEKLKEEDFSELREYCNTKLLEGKIPSLVNHHKQLKVLKDNCSQEKKEDLNAFISEKSNLDLINQVLLYYKTDDEIERACKEKGIPEFLIKGIQNIDECKDTIELSLNILNKINPLLLEGMTYDKAMEKIGYSHSNNVKVEVQDFLPPIEDCINGLHEQLTNPTVRHTLVEMRKVVNAIIKKYGKPHNINIELATELCLGEKARREMDENRRDNEEANFRDKAEIFSKYPFAFKSIDHISKQDILKYRLFKEQRGICLYSGKFIVESELFDNNLYQIDHIIPYSRSYNDNYSNKVLVSAKMNQEKKNQTPFEAFGQKENWNIILNLLESNKSISQSKIDNILTQESDFTSWIDRNLNDTRYISKLARRIIKSYLGYNDQECVATNGKITSLMKKCYGLNGYTHSIISSDYKYKPIYKINELKYTNASITLVGEKKLSEKIIENFEEEVKEVSGKAATNRYGIYKNAILRKCIENIDYVRDNVLGYSSISDLQVALKEKIDKSEDDQRQSMLLAISELIKLAVTSLEENDNKKNRGNHLHHALDAALIACTNSTIIHRSNNYNKLREENENFGKGPMIQQPYEEFSRELLIRVYERDQKKLVEKLKEFRNYQNVEFDDSIKVIYPTKFPAKNKKGPLTNETMMGRRGNAIYKRIDVHKLKFEGKANWKESIYDYAGGNKRVVESIEKWLNETDKKDLESTYPIHISRGNYIKKVLVYDSTVERRVLVNKELNSYAENADVIYINVYKKDEKYYMVPLFYRNICNKDENQIVELMWKQGESGRAYLPLSKINKEYTYMFTIPRYSLIEIETNEGKGLAYSAGCSSGMFEIYSALGDGYDLINARIQNKIKPQFIITISQIKSIKLRNISMLGNLN